MVCLISSPSAISVPLSHKVWAQYCNIRHEVRKVSVFAIGMAVDYRFANYVMGFLQVNGGADGSRVELSVYTIQGTHFMGFN